MIKVSAFYPDQEGARFDMNYYCNRHIPMVRAKLGSACKGVAVEQGQAGAAPGSRPEFLVMGHLYFESVESFQESFNQHSTEILQDVANYTNLQPMIQVSEVKIAVEPSAVAAAN